MNILYHRISGAVGLTAQESGTRGAWVEKRLTTLRWLKARGHEVTILSRLTRATHTAPQSEFHCNTRADARTADLLVLEFGPSNGSWYAEDYAFTQAVVGEYAGPIVYLCDDPDLLKSSVCRYVPQIDWSRWTFLLNCQRPECAPAVLGAPAEASYSEFNPGVGLSQVPYAPSEEPLLVYPGRPGGRKEQVNAMLDSQVVQVVSSPHDWKSWEHLMHHPLLPSPEQADRRDFYRRYAALVCAFDEKHAKLGWRTGRAYHALSAGVPVLAFPGNAALWWTKEVSSSDDLTTEWALLTNSDEYRSHLAISQRDFVSSDETDLISLPTAQALGL